MLHPNKERLDYGNLLMPPEGFQLDNAIATSYSLDLEALISVPVALYFAHSLDLNLRKDVVQVMDAIRRASESIKVFCQKGQIKVPDNQHRLYSFVEPCIVQVPPTQESSFHPKVWAIRYKNQHGEIKYRVIVLSRNLTFDRSWDVAFQIEGDLKSNRQNNFRNTKPLVDFVTYLSRFEKIPWIQSFVADLGKTEFNITSNQFEEFAFLPMGLDGYRKNILFDNNLYDELLIISPFVTASGLQIAKEHSRNKPTLFSREFELKKINKELLTHFTAYHLLSEFVEGEEKQDADTEENMLLQLQDLHAKVYVYKAGRDSFLLLGSANCSKRAMENNVEFMVLLKGKNSKIGPDVIFKELVNDELAVFQKYSHAEKLTEREKLSEEQEQKLQRVKIELVNVTLRATAIKQEDSNYQIDVDFHLETVDTNPEIEISANLLNSEQTEMLQAGIRNRWSIRNISELDISCFLILDLKLKGSVANLRFAMKIVIANLPLSRNAKIFRDIISNTANFFKYIRFLLSENYWDEQLSFEDEDGKHSDENSYGHFFSEEPIYENMLKAISREPEKLAEIKKVMEKLSEEQNNETPIIPEDFKDLWNVFDQIQTSK